MTTWWDVRRNSWCMNILQTNRTIGSAHLFHTLKDKKVGKMTFTKFNKMPTLCWFSSFLGRHISHVWQWKNLSLPPTLQIPRKRTNNINCQIIFKEMKITTSFTVILFFIFIINQLALPTKILQNKVNYVVVGKIIITFDSFTWPKRIPQLEQFCWTGCFVSHTEHMISSTFLRLRVCSSDSSWQKRQT